MEVIDIRNEKMAASLIENLKRRHYDAYYCHDTEEMKHLVVQLIPEGSSVTWGGSATIRDTGVTTLLKEGNYQVYDRDEAKNPEEKKAIYLKAFTCDYYLASANAISEDGVIVNIDGNGNRVAAITWGPQHVIFIVGMNKVCQDTDAAIKRARSTAAPINMARFDFKTPCQKDGRCHDCKSPDSICNYISILRNSHPAKRHIVILVNENLGY
ncbi:MAG: lactate utilization protein [Prevotella sp.]|jgi:L-lactate utilization protein LutB